MSKSKHYNYNYVNAFITKHAQKLFKGHSNSHSSIPEAFDDCQSSFIFVLLQEIVNRV